MASEEQSKSSIEPVIAPKGHGGPGHGHPGDAAKHGDKALRLLGDEPVVLTDEDVSPPLVVRGYAPTAAAATAAAC